MKMLLLGDLSPTIASNPLFKEKNMQVLFNDALGLFEGNDYTMVNLECALTDHDGAIEKFGPALKATKTVAEVLKTLHVDCCGLSNNHIFDFGKKGALDTMEALDEAGIAYTGFGENYEASRKDLLVEKDGEKIAILAVCEHEYSYALEDRMGSRPYDEYDTMEDIRAAKASADRVIVIYHGGKEECRYPSPRLLKLCRAMVKNGADVVLCQHSHCIGCYEEYNGGHILYGQGNFHFCKSDFMVPEKVPFWSSALAVHYDSKENTIAFTPIVNKGPGIELAKGDEKERLLCEFNERNASLKDGTWQDGWHAFCETKRELYDMVICNYGKENRSYEESRQFGHFLDCEAHTDVWRELHKTANHTNEK